MKIGLIRHFKVTRGYPASYVTSDELMKWVEEYDASDVEGNEVDLKDIDWEGCYSSDLSRAQITAEAVYEGEITFLKELREIRLSPIFRSDIKLPLFLHMASIRLAWWFNHRSQPENKREIEERIRVVVDRVVHEGKDVLIVGHGGIMIFMRKELRKRGFTGPSFRRPSNGKVYVYQGGTG
ncbi:MULTISPECIES: phosphoglycerate mutase family protein [Rossellomorea]|uniref:histidine phosphatase family protein n=1 Tax=Rossellomorea TaxID=2837508 RepID=UPI001CCCA8AE|nr:MULTISPECIES: phosphoglycerate mutase family protein [Rossellomorea]MCA0150153.1 histidine phosphatase family protein [Rossellomorea vietnamensis]WGG46034.1 phosphoglycerate mutase family protein [Rossellomorea sp. DA94]